MTVRQDDDADDIAQRAHAAIAAGDWPAARSLLHPYLHWTDGAGAVGRAAGLAGIPLECLIPSFRHGTGARQWAAWHSSSPNGSSST
jgi:hypothetical protein